MIGIPAVPKFWCDYYACREDNIVQTINYMLSLHKEDFPNTACGGFRIEKLNGIVKIYPEVLRQTGG